MVGRSSDYDPSFCNARYPERLRGPSILFLPTLLRYRRVQFLSVRKLLRNCGLRRSRRMSIRREICVYEYPTTWCRRRYPRPRSARAFPPILPSCAVRSSIPSTICVCPWAGSTWPFPKEATTMRILFLLPSFPSWSSPRGEYEGVLLRGGLLRCILLRLSRGVSSSFKKVGSHGCYLRELFSFRGFFCLFFQFLRYFIFLSMGTSFRASFRRFVRGGASMSPRVPFSYLLLPPRVPPRLRREGPCGGLPYLSFLSRLQSCP